MQVMTKTSKKTTSTKSTGRAKPMSPPGGYSGKRTRYPNGGKVSK